MNDLENTADPSWTTNNSVIPLLSRAPCILIKLDIQWFNQRRHSNPTWTHTQQPWCSEKGSRSSFNTQKEHIISPKNKQTWRSSIPVTIHCFYCHSFKFLFVTNFYFHFSFSPWRRFVFKPKYWAICLNIYCFVLSFCLLLHRLAVRISLLFYIFLPFDSLPYPTLTICRRVRSVNHVTTKRKEIDHILWVWGSVEASVAAPLLTLLEMWRRTGKTGYLSIWKEW